MGVFEECPSLLLRGLLTPGFRSQSIFCACACASAAHWPRVHVCSPIVLLPKTPTIPHSFPAHVLRTNGKSPRCLLPELRNSSRSYHQSHPVISKHSVTFKAPPHCRRHHDYKPQTVLHTCTSFAKHSGVPQPNPLAMRIPTLSAVASRNVRRGRSYRSALALIICCTHLHPSEKRLQLHWRIF